MMCNNSWGLPISTVGSSDISAPLPHPYKPSPLPDLPSSGPPRQTPPFNNSSPVSPQLLCCGCLTQRDSLSWKSMPRIRRRWEAAPTRLSVPQALIGEKNYDIGNRELLAIKVALEEWCHWLEGAQQPFLMFTNFHLSYRPGAQNIKPDALS